MPVQIIVVIAVAVALILAVPITFFATSAYNKKVAEQKIGSAEEKATKR